ncbi:MAG TPA: HNH endonuclease signature motif containing protein [Roseiarcus sp.]|jgi:putative restriction endonuclease
MAETWEHLAGLVWPRLVAAAKAKQKLYYKQVGDEVIHRHHRAVRYALGPIQDFCLAMRLPPLTAIVVNKGSLLPGDGFIAHDIDDIETAFDEVFGYGWENVPNPYARFKPDDSEKGFAIELTRNPDAARDIYQQVGVRGVVQRIFRRALMLAYGEQCAFCGLQFHAALEAAHIKPWGHSDRQQRLDPTNGLLLCSTHHRLFDDHSLTIAPDRTIHYFATAENWDYSDADRMISQLHGVAFRLPEARSLWPSTKRIAERAEIFGLQELTA